MANTSVDLGDGDRLLFKVLLDSDETGRSDMGSGDHALPAQGIIYDATSGGVPPGGGGTGGLFFANG